MTIQHKEWKEEIKRQLLIGGGETLHEAVCLIVENRLSQQREELLREEESLWRLALVHLPNEHRESVLAAYKEIRRFSKGRFITSKIKE